MTKQGILDAITVQLQNSAVTNEGELEQSQLTIVTDELAQVLETVNPNGPTYPSTPR